MRWVLLQQFKLPICEPLDFRWEVSVTRPKLATRAINLCTSLRADLPEPHQKAHLVGRLSRLPQSLCPTPPSLLRVFRKAFFQGFPARRPSFRPRTLPSDVLESIRAIHRHSAGCKRYRLFRVPRRRWPRSESVSCVSPFCEPLDFRW